MVEFDGDGRFLEFASDIDATLPQMQERTGETGGIPWIERPALLFEGGVQKGVNYDASRLDRIIKQFDLPSGDRDWTVPLQLGHNGKDPEKTRGHVRELWRDGLKLYGRIRAIGQQAIDNVRGAVWNRVSIGLGGADGLKLKHVAITPDPHVVTAAIFEGGTPITMAAKPKPEETDEEKAAREKQEAEDDKAEMAEKKHAKEMAAKDEQISKMKAEMDAMKKGKGKEMASKEACGAEMAADPDMTAINADLAALRAELTAEREKRLQFEAEAAAKAEKTARFSRAKEAITTYGRAGKLAPVQFEAEAELVATFDDSQFEAYRKKMDTAPALFHLGLISKPDMRPAGEEFSAADQVEQARQMAKLTAKFGKVRSAE